MSEKRPTKEDRSVPVLTQCVSCPTTIVQFDYIGVEFAGRLRRCVECGVKWLRRRRANGEVIA